MTELTQLIDKEIPDGRQSLQENFSNLERLAQYCQENYIKVFVGLKCCKISSIKFSSGNIVVCCHAFSQGLVLMLSW